MKGFIRLSPVLAINVIISRVRFVFSENTSEAFLDIDNHDVYSGIIGKLMHFSRANNE